MNLPVRQIASHTQFVGMQVPKARSGRMQERFGYLMVWLVRAPWLP